jgi:hypothetical protein
MTFSISGMATSTTGGHENWAKAGFHGKNFIIKRLVAKKELTLLFFRQALHGPVQQGVVGRCCR